MYNSNGKKFWVLMLFMLSGFVIGYFIGSALTDIASSNPNLSFLSFLGFYRAFGLDSISLNLLVIELNFGITFNISICGIIFMFLGFLLYKKVY